jgi:hypothetical protein
MYTGIVSTANNVTELSNIIAMFTAEGCVVTERVKNQVNVF